MPPIVDGVSYINIATGHVNVLMRLYTFVYFSCDYSELRIAIAQSQRTTFTSNMFAGSEIQPYSPESHEKASTDNGADYSYTRGTGSHDFMNYVSLDLQSKS